MNWVANEPTDEGEGGGGFQQFQQNYENNDVCP